jgi:membrane protein DedA with SNARE-associated domain
LKDGVTVKGPTRLAGVYTGEEAGGLILSPRARALIDAVIEQFTYLGIFLVLFLGGVGAPIPEELPILAAGALAREGIIRWWIALPVCVFGVLSGDVVLYWVGHHWGVRILEWRVVRRVLSREREERLKAAYRRHGVKIVFTARHVMGLRAAAFLTAGISHVPFWKFLAVDAGASLLGVPAGFGLAYFFTDHVERIIADVHRIERWIALAGMVALAALIAVLAYRRDRALSVGRRPPGARSHML